MQHFKKLGLWGWAGSICQQHAQDGNLAQLVLELTSEDDVRQIQDNLNNLMEKTETLDNLVHVLKVRVALLLYAKIYYNASIPKDRITIIQDMMFAMGQFHFMYFLDPALAASFYCLGSRGNVKSLKTMQGDVSGCFSGILKWCSTLTAEVVARHTENTRTRILQLTQQ